MHPDAFRRWFLISIVGLGCYLSAETLVKLFG
jgi:hypothetical protein